MTYLDELNYAVAVSQAENKLKQNRETKRWQHAMTPLEQRLDKLLAEMPEGLKVEGIKLSTLQRMLKGRWRGNCHPGELGLALRRKGFVRTRKWRDADNGFAALWVKAAL
ncbi:MAG: hypothetical protein HOP26_07360 [Methylotenera sp.]|nr:hypothetical protein [Methylotenera sp.]